MKQSRSFRILSDSQQAALQNVLDDRLYFRALGGDFLKGDEQDVEQFPAPHFFFLVFDVDNYDSWVIGVQSLDIEQLVLHEVPGVRAQVTDVSVVYLEDFGVHVLVNLSHQFGVVSTLFTSQEKNKCYEYLKEHNLSYICTY